MITCRFDGHLQIAQHALETSLAAVSPILRWSRSLTAQASLVSITASSRRTGNSMSVRAFALRQTPNVESYRRKARSNASAAQAIERQHRTNHHNGDRRRAHGDYRRDPP